MRYISGIRIKNYRLLRDASLGLTTGNAEPLTPLTVVIGRNGFGKSTLCDALGFIVDCLKGDAEQACIARGGFENILSKSTGRNSDRIIEFQIRYSSIFYSLCITAGDDGVPFIYAETLSHINSDFGTRDEMNFYVNNGEGKVVRPNSESVIDIHLADKRQLVLSTLGNLTQFPDIVSFRQFLDSWYLCCFTPDAARTVPVAGTQRHLSRTGSNLANVIQYWEREYPGRLTEILRRGFGKVLGIERIETVRTEDARLLLRFFEKGQEQPFYANQMSDGTLKLLAYMLLLDDPHLPPLLCFEEPENGLYHKLLSVFIDEIRSALDGQHGTQFFITTHQPYLVDSLMPDEVWILEKGEDGFANVRRASDDATVRSMVAEGMPLGALWFSEYLDSN
jgi:predicted ATPase